MLAFEGKNRGSSICVEDLVVFQDKYWGASSKYFEDPRFSKSFEVRVFREVFLVLFGPSIDAIIGQNRANCCSFGSPKLGWSTSASRAGNAANFSGSFWGPFNFAYFGVNRAKCLPMLLPQGKKKCELHAEIQTTCKVCVTSNCPCYSMNFWGLSVLCFGG